MSMKHIPILLLYSTILISGANAIPVIEGEVTAYRNGTVSFNDLRINQVEEISINEGYGNNLKIEALSSKEEFWNYNKELTFKKYIMPIGKYRTVNKRINMIRIPANYTETRIIFYRNGSEKLTVTQEDLNSRLCSNFDNKCSSYCEGKGVDVDCTCGDGVCQESSNERELCSQDCRGSPQPEIEENNQENQSDTEKIREAGKSTDVVDSRYNTGILIVIGVLAILLALVLASSKVKIEV